MNREEAKDKKKSTSKNKFNYIPAVGLGVYAVRKHKSETDLLGAVNDLLETYITESVGPLIFRSKVGRPRRSGISPEYTASFDTSEGREEIEPPFELMEKVSELEERTLGMERKLNDCASEINSLKMEISSRDYLQHLGVSSDEANNGITLPVRVYLSDERGRKKADLILFRSRENHEIVAINDGVVGSYFRDAYIRVFGEGAARHALSLEKAAELKVIGKPQAEVDKLNAETILLLKQSIEDSDEGMAQNGAVIVAKFIAGGKTTFQSKVLTAQELIYIENNKEQLKKPQDLFFLLESVGDESSEQKLLN
jgi:hypothetical protein